MLVLSADVMNVSDIVFVMGDVIGVVIVVIGDVLSISDVEFVVWVEVVICVDVVEFVV